jgi:RNA polymerase sigma-70 factor (ECF subfamily)
MEAVLTRSVEGQFEKMVHEHQDRIFAFALAMSGNRHDAEEIAQDTFLRAYRALAGYTPERIRDLKQRAWLHQIALNVTRNRVRGLKPKLVELNGSEPDLDPGPEARAIQREGLDALAVRVAGLPIRYREAVVLRYVQELSYAEVAEALQQPVGTVKSNVHRGLELLRGDESE